MEKLITLDDIRKYRDITSNIDDVSRIDPYILEAQTVELKKLMGLKFFHLFISKVSDTRMMELRDGKVYQVEGVDFEYAGVKPIISYYAYARMLYKQGVSVTRFGVVKKESQYSTPVDDATIAGLVNDAKAVAKVYEEEFHLFLNENRDTYPEFFQFGQIQKPAKTSIKISPVGRL